MNTSAPDTAVDLAELDEAFAGAPIEERDFAPLPDGKYHVNVEKVEMTRAQSTGNPMLKWTLRVLSPQAKGRLMWRHSVIASSDNLKWLKTDLHTCGLELEKLSDLPKELDRLLDLKLEVTKRTRGESENIFINRRLAGADPDEAADDAPQGDIKPF